ncbi:MAG: hypothetical protein LC121_16680 [Anaerolineae bacterium]|nr:hypothetical protein [Anaerolineae bacterium]
MHQHTSDPEGAAAFARRNIDAWWPQLEAGCEAIVTTASGCGLHVKEYGYLLRGDSTYAAKAKRISEMARDLSEVIAREDLERSGRTGGLRVAFRSPCSQQHGRAERRGGRIRRGGLTPDRRRDICAAARPAATRCCNGSPAQAQR